MPNDEICGLNGRVIGINKNHAIIQCFRGTVIVYPYCMLKDCPELNDALSLGDRVAFRAKIQGTSHSRMTAIKGSVMVMSDAYATGSGYVKFVKQDLYGSGSDDGEYGFISVDKIDTERLPDEIDSDVFFHRTALGSECNDISDILSVGSEVYFVAKRAPPNASTKFSALWVSPVNRNAGKISDRVNSAFETMQRKFGVSSDGEKTLNLADGRGDESGDSVELE